MKTIEIFLSKTTKWIELAFGIEMERLYIILIMIILIFAKIGLKLLRSRANGEPVREVSLKFYFQILFGNFLSNAAIIVLSTCFSIGGGLLLVI